MIPSSPPAQPRIGPIETVHFCRAIERPSTAFRRSQLVQTAIAVGAGGLVLMPLIYAAQRLGRWTLVV